MAPTPDAKPQRRTPVSYLIGAIALIILGCVTNNLVLELLVSKKKNPFADPGAGSLLTFLQFVLIAMLTLPGVLVWRPVGGLLLPRLAPTRVPLKHYAAMTGLFFGMSFLNNWAFAFNISQPLHSEQRGQSWLHIFPPDCWSRAYPFRSGLSLVIARRHLLGRLLWLREAVSFARACPWSLRACIPAPRCSQVHVPPALGHPPAHSRRRRRDRC